MRFRYQLVASIPAVTVGLTVGHVAASLDAPSPWPEFSALAVTVVLAYFLDRLAKDLLAYRTASRG
jgi:hypothetical protein